LADSQYIKFNKNIWYVKNFVDRLRKGERNMPKIFYPTFSINLEEFRFYGEVGRGETPPTVSRSPAINLPPINQFFNNAASTPPTSKKNGDRGSVRYSESVILEDPMESKRKVSSPEMLPFTHTHYKR
jgi:hypothetical protein